MQNSMDRGDSWATVHRVTVGRLSFFFHFASSFWVYLLPVPFLELDVSQSSSSNRLESGKADLIDGFWNMVVQEADGTVWRIGIKQEALTKFVVKN